MSRNLKKFVHEFGLWFHSDQVNLGELDVTARVVVTGGKFVAVINNTKGPCAAGIVDTVVHLEFRYL
jgi:hypothetical protein